MKLKTLLLEFLEKVVRFRIFLLKDSGHKIFSDFNKSIKNFQESTQ